MGIIEQNYPLLIEKIMDIALSWYKKKEKNRKEFKRIIEEIFNFLQVKCSGSDYVNNDSFLKLLNLHEKLEQKGWFID